MSELDVRTGSRSIERGDLPTLELRWACATDTGLKREVNQDALLVDFPLFIVADGMGGHEAGEVASAAVIDRLSALARSQPLITRDGIENSLRAAVADMSAAVGESELGTGTTVTGVYCGTEHQPLSGWTVLNIGDSRVYRLHNGLLEQLTVDHSVVQELIAAGAISADEAESHPHGNVITRAVGLNEDPVPDYLQLPNVDRARWLVCSDGLTKELTDYGIQHFLTTAPTPAEAVVAMFEAALGNGGRDNISAIVFDERAEGTAPSETAPGAPGETAEIPAERPAAL